MEFFNSKNLNHFTLVVILLLLASCIAKNQISVNVKNPTKAASLNATISNIQVINHQLIITGTNLNGISNFKIKEGATTTNLEIESQTSTSIVANTITNVTFAAGKVFDFVLSNASAAATFTVNFSLCDSTLGGKGFNCTLTPNDKEVLSYDAASGLWKPRAVNGLSYQGAWDATTALPATAVSGDYFIVSVANAPYAVGDWIVFNGTTFDHINNSTLITSVYGRTGAVTANEGDYVLTKMGDVDLTTTPPVANQVLKYNGTNWVPGTAAITETDPTVSAFAKAALPSCGAGQVLKSDGTNFSCVADATGAGAFSGTANRAVLTDGTGALAVSAVTNTELSYLSGVTSSIQTQLNTKSNTSSFVDWSVAGVQTLEPTRLNLTIANAVVVTSAGGVPTASGITTTQLGYLSGVSSNIQTQLNTKQATIDKSSVQDVSKLRVYGANAANYVELTAPVLAGNTNFSFPVSNGTSGYVLQTDGAGNTSWVALAGAPVSSVFGRTGVVVSASGDYTGTQITNTAAGNIAATNVQAAINELDTEKQSIASFAADVRAVVLTGLSTATNAVIAATDTVLGAFGKLQAQISANTTSIGTKADTTNVSQTITAAAVTGLTAPVAGSDAVNKTYVDGIWAPGTGANVGDIYRATGNVGIGTTTPGATLDVQGTTSLKTLDVYDATAANYVTFYGASDAYNFTALTLQSVEAISKKWQLAHKADPTVLNDFQFGYHNGSSWSFPMVIKANGNVGIGTTSPAAALDVNGDVSVNSSNESAVAYVNSTTAYTVPDTLANIRRITLTGNATITLPAFTTPTAKVYTLTIFLKQDATGSRTVTFAGNGADTILWDANTAPTIAATAGKISILQFTKPSDETVWYASQVWKGE